MKKFLDKFGIDNIIQLLEVGLYLCVIIVAFGGSGYLISMLL